MEVDASISSDLTYQILARFEARLEEIVERIASDIVQEVKGFGPINDARLVTEFTMLARIHLDGFVDFAHSGVLPQEALAAAGERARQRAREMVPLGAMLHSFLIAQRVVTAAIAGEAEADALSRGAALTVVTKSFDYNIALTAAMAEAYVEVVQGDLAELDSARRSLIDTLLTSDADAWQALSRRASGLGFDPEREYVVALAVVDLPNGDAEPGHAPPRWAGQAIARWSGRPDRRAFVVSRERDLVALLDASGPHRARSVLTQTATTIDNVHQSTLRAGVGGPFRGVGGFSNSYRQARRALRHTGRQRPFVLWPHDVLLFDELTAADADAGAELIPAATRRLLADGTMRATLEAFSAADLNVAAAAEALSLHPNSLRYRLRRVAEITGRDPRRLTDMIELMAAARLIAATTGDSEGAQQG